MVVFELLEVAIDAVSSWFVNVFLSIDWKRVRFSLLPLLMLLLLAVEQFEKSSDRIVMMP